MSVNTKQGYGNESRAAGRGVVCATPKKVVVLTFDQHTSFCDYTLATTYYYFFILLYNALFWIATSIH